jgi:hypothetical protein
MAPELESKIRSWTLTLPYGPGVQETNAQIEHLAEDLFNEYEPTRPPHPSFWQRLDGWIGNVPDDLDQRTMFEFVPHLFFVGPREMEILHRVAFNTNVARWLIEQLRMSLDDPGAEHKLAEAVRRTWFCPITDSMRIPMMSISHSDLMPIRSERSDAGLSQFEIVIGISQDFCLFSLS